MITRAHPNSSLSWPLYTFVIGFLFLLVLCGVPGLTNQAQAQESAGKKADYADEAFAQQLKEVQKQYPLVAKALDFLERVPRFCLNLDKICKATFQNICLESGVSQQWCLERALEFCCKESVFSPK